ncbi:GNAT family N-acetyltransferase [Tumidithrix elongata RA019]|uniref:GNAT family N-acetyltransferase n=1 Tax=Tumidithrix elongata BACA0141 TaxID=2716417 RepID=A0AAW9PZV8_9CYAN|nr:GNAT family N-acetyltransferase [Tumidithrix elongata RA019]
MGIQENLTHQLLIRPYQSEDLEAIVQLWYNTWHETFPHLQHPHLSTEWKRRFLDELIPLGSIWTAEIEGEIAGFMVIFKRKSFIDQLFVDRRYQSHGIGAKLLGHAKSLHPQGLRLYTLRENTRARAFYERNGFTAGKLSVNAFNGQPNVEYIWKPKQ